MRNALQVLKLINRVKQSPSTTSIMDRQLLHQKVHQKISVVKASNCDDITKIVHFGTLVHVSS